jgi:hypothetical protein
MSDISSKYRQKKVVNNDQPPKDTEGTDFMKAFVTKYKSMTEKEKWVLKTGTVVEDNLFKFGKKCKFEHLCHSFIIDPNDETYLQRRVFTEEELTEIKTSNMIEYPELPDDLVDYFSLFEMGTTSKELRKLNHIHSDLQLDYDSERDHMKDCINRTLSQLVLLYKNPFALATEHTEQWFQSRVWLFLEYALYCEAYSIKCFFNTN